MSAIVYSAFQEFPKLAVVSTGFFISLRILRFPDLSIDAAYMIGMSVVGFVITNNSENTELFALPFAIIFGMLSGILTGTLNTLRHTRINKFLAGMLVSFAAYSICCRILDNKANLSLFKYQQSGQFALKDMISSWSPQLDSGVVVGIFFVCVVYFVFTEIMKTPFGYAMRIVGRRPEIVHTIGYNPRLITVMGLGFANAIVGLGGWINTVNTTNVVLENFGVLIHALAAVVFGELLLGVISKCLPGKTVQRLNSPYFLALVPIIGALIYTIIKSTVLLILSKQLTVSLTSDFQLVVAVAIMLTYVASRKIQDDHGEDEEPL